MNSALLDEREKTPTVASAAEAVERPRLGDKHCVAILIALWAAAIVLVDPRGNFPIGDDFGFAPPVWTLLETGRLKLTDWGAMNLVSQVAWGALFSAVLGKTYLALRISTLVLGMLGALIFYALLRRLLRPAVALLGACLLIANPLYLTTSFTFMTDVPFTVMQLSAMWLLLSGWERGSRWRIATGWALAAATLLCRQTGLVIPIAAAFVYLAARPITRDRLLRAALPIVALIALQQSYRLFLELTNGVPKNYGLEVRDAAAALHGDPLQLALRYTRFYAYAGLYLGLFLLPLGASRLGASSPKMLRRPWLTLPCLAIGYAMLILTLTNRVLFPYFGGIWQIGYGVGTEFTGTSEPLWLRLTETLLALLGVCSLAVPIVIAIRRAWTERPPVVLFGTLMALGLVAPLPLLVFWWDRYLIPALPCAILAIAPAFRDVRARGLTIGFTLTAALGTFSAVAAHDFMAFKRSQWKAYTDLRQAVAACEIDADWTINGSNFLPLFIADRNLKHWRTSQNYVIWPGPRTAHVVAAEYPVDRWLPWNRNSPPVYVLRALVPIPPASCGE